MPKLSMSVKASLMSPVHCLEILPTSFSPSGVMILNSTSPAQEKVHQGPLMIRATLPSPSVISNLTSHVYMASLQLYIQLTWASCKTTTG